MRCWSCGKKMPDKAKRCPHCEASAEEEPTQEEIDAVEGLLEEMPRELRDQIQDAYRQSDNAEEFINRLMVGDCPKCGSSETGDCENDPEVDDICVGRCFECGQLWCLDCEEVFSKGQIRCSHAKEHEAAYEAAFESIQDSRPKRKKRKPEAKPGPSSPLLGRWRIIEMEREDFERGGKAFVKFDQNSGGDLRFASIQGTIDYRLTEREGKPAVEWSWDGDDEQGATCGRGYAVLESADRLVGRIFIHCGRESGFVARKARKKRA